MGKSLASFAAGAGMTLQQFEHHFDPTRPVSREEQLHRFQSAVFTLYWQAEYVRRRGISWRNFCVGCAAWAFREDAPTYDSRWRMFIGMNTKVAEQARNICAEPIPLNAALASSYTEIIGVVVIGEAQEDNKGKHLTLRPCAHCRELMKSHPLMRPDTIIITALPPPRDIDSLDEVPHEVHTLQELLEIYDEA
jgi:cytidine deaminase